MDFLFHKLSYIYNIRKESNRKIHVLYRKLYFNRHLMLRSSSGLMSQNVVFLSERRKRLFSTKAADLKINFYMIQIYLIIQY